MARSKSPMTKANLPPEHASRIRSLAGTALRIVDAEGLAALTMRRLAADAGMKPMSLYWYFADKDAVLTEMTRLVDQEIREEQPPRSSTQSGAEWLGELVSRAVRVLTRHHPDITVLTQSQVSGSSAEIFTDNTLENFEGLLGYLAARGTTGIAAVQLAHLISQSVFMLALVCRRDADGQTSPDARIRAQWESLRSVSAERYPHIRAASEAFVHEERTTTLLERGVELFTGVMHEASTD